MAQHASATEQKPQWRDLIWWSGDGIRLHARVYDPPADAPVLPPVLCIPGLTRNARDFEQLAPHLARHRRVYALDLRGRGESGYAKDAMTYVPLTYVQDVVALLEAEAITRFCTIGTSLGGLVTMLIAIMHPGRIAGSVLNDVGPEIAAEGLERIRGYVGQVGRLPTWVHAARAIAEVNAEVYPHWQLEDWLVMAKRSHKLTPEGLIVADYDSNIAQPIRVPGGEAGVDLWPAFEALASAPMLIVRGALSDILSADVAKRMVKRAPAAKLVTVPRVGHAPTLDESPAVAAIDALLESVTA